MEPMLDEKLEELEEELLSRAFLYNDETVFREAVEGTFEAVRALLSRALVAA